MNKKVDWCYNCEKHRALCRCEQPSASERSVTSNDLLCVPNRADALQDIANAVCKHTPPGYVISLCIEDGSAWVDLGKDNEGFLKLPDSSDKTLLEQLNDALCVANGWNT
jgi:hypothetical protein